MIANVTSFAETGNSYCPYYTEILALDNLSEVLDLLIDTGYGT